MVKEGREVKVGLVVVFWKTSGSVFLSDDWPVLAWSSAINVITARICSVALSGMKGSWQAAAVAACDIGLQLCVF